MAVVQSCITKRSSLSPHSHANMQMERFCCQKHIFPHMYCNKAHNWLFWDHNFFSQRKLLIVKGTNLVFFSTKVEISQCIVFTLVFQCSQRSYNIWQTWNSCFQLDLTGHSKRVDLILRVYKLWSFNRPSLFFNTAWTLLDKLSRNFFKQSSGIVLRAPWRTFQSSSLDGGCLSSWMLI